MSDFMTVKDKPEQTILGQTSLADFAEWYEDWFQVWFDNTTVTVPESAAGD